MKRIIATALLSGLVFVLTLFLIPHLQREGLTRGAGKERGEKSGARGALDFWTRARAYPDHDIPADKYNRAFQLAKRTNKHLPEVLSAANWEPIGPINLHGRSLSVAVNPMNSSTILVGTASGGLWRSHTSGLGNDWNQIKLGFPVLGVSSVLYDPTDSNTIYLGTGEVYALERALGGLVVRTTRGSYGVGILKTTDGGQTWVKSLDWSYEQQKGVQKLAMNPMNPHTLYATTTEGIYKTMDAGETWNNLYPIPLIFHDVIVHAVDTNKVMVTLGNLNHGPLSLIRSSDGGGSWEGVVGIPPRSGKAHLGMSQSNPDIVYATVPDSTPTDFPSTSHASIFKTTNFGDSWTEISTGLGIWGVQGWYSHYVAVYPTDPDLIIFNSVGSSRSTDGGSSFSYSSGNYSDNHGYAIDPNNPDIFYTVNDDGIYRSTDFGMTYTSVGLGLQTGQLYKGFSNSTTNPLLSLVQSQDHIPGYIYRGTTLWDFSAIDEAGWTAIDPTDDHLMYAINRWGFGLYKSTDQGNTFTYTFNFSAGIGSWNSPLVISPSSPAILYFGDTRVFKSLNHGATFSITNGGSTIDGGNTALSLAVSPTNSDTVYVGMAPLVTNAHTYRTINGGTSWTSISVTLPDRYPMDIAIDPTNTRTVYEAFGGFGTPHLFKSIDAGDSWSDITGTLPDVPTTSVVVDPANSNIVYAGNDLGVYVSTNSGASWSSFSEGLPDAVIVSDLKFSQVDRTVRLGTHGNGAYRRKAVGELSSQYVDYAPYTLISPQDKTIFTIDSTISHIVASFRNLSAQAQTESLDVRFRIVKDGSDVYTSTQRIPAIAIGETRQVSFSPSFTFTAFGSYQIEALCLPGDVDATNDTLRGSIGVIGPPTIADYDVQKLNCPYVELAGGSAGPSGDDVQSTAALPFQFTYDGFSYDAVQISTNGWLEFGTSTPDWLLGLSTPGQLGTSFCYCEFNSTRRPTKTLDPWWTDLATTSTPPASSITYGIEGNSPDRTFVVQWKNMLAFYDESQTTMRLNFQVRLHEGTNVFEFHYGPVVPGTLNNFQYTNIGFKDVLGGDYRFYDLVLRATGTVNDIAYVSPNEWPGQDNCFVMTPGQGPRWIAYDAGWNLVSLPLASTDQRVQMIYPGLPVFRFSGNYQSLGAADSLRPGEGYWVKFPSVQAHEYAGTAIDSLLIPLRAGWNIFGTLSHTRITQWYSSLDPIFGYSPGNGYFIPTLLVPGSGYWVHALSDGLYALVSGAEPKQAVDVLAGCSHIAITDARGRHQTLFLSEDQQLDPSRFLLPPLPPVESFDARFASGRMLERIPLPDRGEVARFPIVMQSPTYPLTVSYVVRNGNGHTLVVEEKGLDGAIIPHVLSEKGEFSIAKGNERTLSIKAETANTPVVPSEFSLDQNYPNPFNPSTAIRYSLPIAGRVSLRVYNALGQVVATLADEVKEAGWYTAHWNAINSSSGIYFCRLESGTFTSTRKMLLIR